ncbi:MAG: metallophosphoesterase [Clostridia bacterium]|nr:metallophosphoesterase [Clostridia bacterium]
MGFVEDKKAFFAQDKLDFTLDHPCEEVSVYRLKESNQVVCEFTINANVSSPITIAQLTDLHFNYFLEEDYLDEELLLTKKHRLWLKDGEALKSAKSALEACKYFDACVITGDILDFLSKGTIYLAKKYIFEAYPDYICTPGGHEYVKQMQTGVKDKLPLEARKAIVEGFWNTNSYYVSKLVGERVLIIAINNGLSHYDKEQVEKLTQDIKRAKKENLTVLIFQHEPISTRKICDQNHPAFIVTPGNVTHENFYDKVNLVCSTVCSTKEDNDVYDIITSNADVIKGVFCGHWHAAHYVNLDGYYIKDGLVIPCPIPQIVSAGNPYFEDGFIMKIIVK